MISKKRTCHWPCFLFFPCLSFFFLRLLNPDEPDTGRIRMSELGSTRQSRSIHPMNLVKYMKDRGEVTENEEEALEDKGGFLKQAWLALKFLKNKVSVSRAMY